MIARVATATGIAACLSFGVVFTADAASAPDTDPGLDLLEAAADALGDQDTTTYEELVDAAEQGSVWLPTAARDALFDRDVEDLAFWLLVLDADDDLLLDGATETIAWEHEALEAIPPGGSSSPEQTEDINDADADGASLLEVIDVRGVEIPESARLVLAPLSVTGEVVPTGDDYENALTDLDSLIAGDDGAVAAPTGSTTATTIATVPTPAASESAETVTPSTQENVTAPTPTTAINEDANANATESSSNPLAMIAVAVIAAAGFALASYAMLRGRKSDQLADIAFTDGLTGLKNRRRLDADVAAQRDRGERATATLMIDVDHFKAFNDTHGHAMGDEVLRMVGDALRQEFRRTDVPYRYGGEEFCVLLNDVTPGEAVSAGERARAAISTVALPIPERITVSIGVSIGAAEHLGDTIKRADGALYDAKAAGRDRVNFAAS